MAALFEVIERSADPPAVERAMARLTQDAPTLPDRLDAQPELRAALVAVLGTSRSLTRLLLTDPEAMEVLAHLEHRPLRTTQDHESLVAWKRRELLRIAARDLLGWDGLEVVGAALADLAEDVLRAAVDLAGDQAQGIAVIGMGKLGARELNYASDIDLLFAAGADGGGDPRPVVDIARRCFRVDVNLRPEGRDGPLVRTVPSYEAYWDRWAQPWEFQALIKARPVAGDVEVGSAFARAAARRLWDRPFGADELRSVRAMKARSEQEVVRRGLVDRELKLGHGGIRDIEFAVQILQLVHAGRDPALRVPATVPALTELAAAGYIHPGDGQALGGAYRFLRAAEHRLQLVEEQQVHAVPADPQARARLARAMGYGDDPYRTALGRFDDRLRAHQAGARAIHERLYFRPLLEAFAGTDGALPAEVAEQRLAAFGFADAERTRVALQELTRGLTRSSRLMAQLLPLVLQWLSESPDPDLGLLGLRALATGPHRASRLVEAFRESPESARQLCLLLGTSRLLQRGLAQHPEVIRALGAGPGLPSRTRTELDDRMRAVIGRPTARLSGGTALRRAKAAEELRIAARDVLGQDDVDNTATELSSLAESVLEAVLTWASPPVPMVVVAMGRLGGAELSYASDLDVLFVYEGQTPADVAAAEASAEAILRLVHGDSPATRLYTLDTGLRPEGKQGPLARSLDAYAAYYQRWAKTWERQALLRARAVAGDPGVGQRFLDLIHPFVWAPLTDAEVRDIRRLKARMERERIPAGEDPQFHLKLGRGSLADVEWTVQLLQLRHTVPEPGTMAALERLQVAGAVDEADATILREAYRFCERTRNRWYLVKGGPGDSLPNSSDQLARLAHSLGVTPARLREDYRRVTRRARAVFERLFYGTPLNGVPGRPDPGS